ncbi:MAG: galactonate dehydratase [Chloroflexi bacterium]|nr:galactonate dehydratase [Chloroflexota bacterium]|tara:strand:+ start:6049 stop:7218 length:1170 start_codon:yes stop_codon:yes gene_type:complete
MKITKITTYLIESKLKKPFWWSNGKATKRSAVLVKISTDEGIEGWGEGYGTQETISVIHNTLKSQIISENPLNREKLWEKMYLSLNNAVLQVGIGGCAISAIDIALWDITGKTYNLSVSELLGGKIRDKILTYATGLYYSENDFPKNLVNEAKYYKKIGFKGMKMKIGAIKPESDIERIKEVRKAIGDDIYLMVDANQAYNLYTAKKLLKKLAEFNILWFEEPLHYYDWNSYAELKKISPIAISGGESLRTSSQFKDFLVNQSYDIVQPDVSNVGGITEFKRIINMASTMGIQTIPHVWGTPVMIAASLHIASTIPNTPRMDNPQHFLQEPGMEYDRTDNPLRENITLETQPFKFDNGYLDVPKKPGLGIEISEEKVQQMSTQKIETNT